MPIDVSSKCLTCLSESSSYHQLFDYVEKNYKILEMLNCLVPQISVKSASQISSNVCQICVEKLLIGYKFQQLCIETNKRLHDLLGIAVFETPVEMENILDPLTTESNLILKENIKDACFESERLSEDLDDVTKSETSTILQSSSGNDSDSSSVRSVQELQSKKGNFHRPSKKSRRSSRQSYFPCTECEQIFTSSSRLEQHATTHDEKQQHVQEFAVTNTLEAKRHDINEKSSKTNVKEKLEQIENENDFENSEENLDEFISKPGASKIKKIDIVGTNKGVVESSIKKSSNYSCEVCGKSFDRPAHLRRHHSSVHSLTRPHECEICKYRFATAKKLKVHLFLHTSDTERFNCPDCPRLFNTKASLLYHREKHNTNNISEEGNYPCMICQQNFVSRRFFTEHITSKHPEVEKYKCERCDKTFVMREHLEDHLNRHRNLVCPICEKEFASNKTLKEHMRTHSNESPYLCPQCGKTFRSAGNLSSHIERHTVLKKYQCPECPSRFTCRSYLIKHAITHSNAKPHVCDICGSCFTRTTSMQKHKLLHTGERPFKCEQCSMTFAVIYHLRRHMRTHTGEKPYKCKYCERAYAESGDLTKHLRTHVGENTYMCDQCPKAFKYQAELRQHQSQHFKIAQELVQKEQNTVAVEQHEIIEQTQQQQSELPLKG